MTDEPQRPTDLAATRELYWQNVLREMLTSLSIECMRPPDKRPPLFDGRLAVLTHGGERIPIAEVHPLFACGVAQPDHRKWLSIGVECTIFQIQTPSGEVFTLPLKEIRSFHSLSDDLMRQLQQTAQKQADEQGAGEPFGFAAFTSLADQATGPADPNGQ